MKFKYPVPSHFLFLGRVLEKKIRDESGTRIPSDPSLEAPKFLYELFVMIGRGQLQYSTLPTDTFVEYCGFSLVADIHYIKDECYGLP